MSYYRYVKYRRLLFYSGLLLITIAVYIICSVSSRDISRLGNFAIEQLPSQKLSSGLVVSDVKIIRCFTGYCNAPDHYVKVNPELNLNAPGSSFVKYILVVKKAPYDSKILQYLEDVKIQPDRPNGQYNLDTYYGMKVWKKYVYDGESDIYTRGLIREVEVLYGSETLVDKRELWDFNTDSISYFNNKVPAHLTLFKVSKEEEAVMRPQIETFEYKRSKGYIDTQKTKFRILQISDLHFGLDDGICVDKQCKSDKKTIDFVRESINKENIDFVVISGDLIDFHRSVDFRSAILKGLQPILENNIPFVFTFGEADTNEFNNPSFFDLKVKIINFLYTLPNCYNELPPLGGRRASELHGLSNYDLKIFRHEAGKVEEKTPNALITILDSEDHKIDSSQINYLYRQNDALAAHDIFKLLFFHYPLPNYRPTGSFQLVGSYNEKHPLNSKSSTKFRDDIYNCGYQVVSVGHEHQNDACLLSEITTDKGLWLCYSSVTGESAKTDVVEDFDRKVRIYELDFVENNLLSWKRSQTDGKAFHYQLLHSFTE